jgi:hypothetical protein
MQRIPAQDTLTGLNSFDASAMLTVRVGKGQKRKDFTAHESFLTSSSEFFRRAMNGSWKEAKTRVIHLSDDNPNIFGLYLNFVYTGELTTTRTQQEESSGVDFNTWALQIQQEYGDLFCIYVLAEKLQDISAKNATMRAAISVTQTVHPDTGQWLSPSLRTANIVYQGTPENNHGRRLVMEICSGLSLNDIIPAIKGYELHQDLVRDLASTLENIRPLSGEYQGNTNLVEEVEKYLEQS